MDDLSERELLLLAQRWNLATFVHRVFTMLEPGKRYQPNWHIEAMCHQLERVRNGRCRRLLIALPPRSLKSLVTSVAFPALVLGHDPTRRIICASYAQDLSAKFSRDCRSVMQHRAYREIFPSARLSRRKSTEGEFETTKGGYRLATSVAGPLTGRGGNILIVDDPLSAKFAVSAAARNEVNEWFTGSALSRLDNKSEDAIIVVMQRLHVDDLIGHLLRMDVGWETLILPAIADEEATYDLGLGRSHTRRAGEPLSPARESLESLALLRRQLGTYAFSAQYQQNPLPLEGGLIQWKWFGQYPEVPATGEGYVVQSWDTANKGTQVSDYSVCLTFHCKDDHHDLIDVFRERLDYPALKDHMVRLAERHRADAVLVEEAGSGIQLIQELGNSTLPIKGIIPEGDKVTRMYTQTAKLENGWVRLPQVASWLEDLKVELLAFPNGTHDDQVDSLSQYLAWATPATMHQGQYLFVRSRVVEEWG